MDVYGRALRDFAQGDEGSRLILHNSYGEPEEMPLWYFFREFDEMPERERMAISICEGNVLDVGAGTGSHSLVLQHFQYDVTALDTSAIAVELMKESGVKKVLHEDFFNLKGKKFDTIFSLMNGIGIIGKLERFGVFLNQVKSLLNEGGQLIFDSSDISYLYEGNPPVNHYYGEVSFQYEYKGIKGEWFDWVYIDPQKLSELADDLGWHVYFLHSDEHDQYLVRMVPQ